MQTRTNPKRAPGDYWIIETGADSYYVSGDTAARVSAAMDRAWLPRWIKIVDVAGCRHWIRARSVLSIEESTQTGRYRIRAFHRACNREFEEFREPD